MLRRTPTPATNPRCASAWTAAGALRGQRRAATLRKRCWPTRCACTRWVGVELRGLSDACSLDCCLQWSQLQHVAVPLRSLLNPPPHQAQAYGQLQGGVAPDAKRRREEALAFDARLLQGGGGA